MTHHQRNYALFLFLALLWSGSFIGIKISVDHLPAVFSALLRVAVGQMVLSLIFITRRKPLVCHLAYCWRLWLIGILSQGLPFALLFYGERTVAPGLASILNSTVSIWALLLNAVFFRDTTQFTLSKVIGLLIGLLGVVSIFWPILHDQQTHTTLIDTLAILAMAISYAIGAILNQRIMVQKVKLPFSVLLWQQQWSSLVFLCVVSLFFEPWPAISLIIQPKVFLAVLYLGIFSTAFAWIIYYYLLREWDAVRASSVMYIVPLLTMLWDYLFFDLRPASSELVGAVAILLGVTLIQLQRHSTMRKP